MPKPLDKDDMYMIQKIEQNPYQDHLNEKEMRREKRELKKLRRKKNTGPVVQLVRTRRS